MGLMDMIKSQLGKQVSERLGKSGDKDVAKAGGSVPKTRKIRVRRGTEPGRRS